MTSLRLETLLRAGDSVPQCTAISDVDFVVDLLFIRGIIDYGWSNRRVNRGHPDFDKNNRSRIDKYTCRVQNDGTPMPQLLAGGIGSNDVTCALVLVINESIAKLQYSLFLNKI